MLQFIYIMFNLLLGFTLDCVECYSMLLKSLVCYVGFILDCVECYSLLIICLIGRFCAQLDQPHKVRFEINAVEFYGLLYI